VAVFGVLLATLLTGCAGQRLLEIRVERGGELLLKGSFAIPDNQTPIQGWLAIAGRPLQAVAPITPDADNPNAAALKGELRVSLTHAGDHFAASQLERLQITRVPGTDDQWEIPLSELERATKPALKEGIGKGTRQ